MFLKCFLSFSSDADRAPQLKASVGWLREFSMKPLIVATLLMAFGFHSHQNIKLEIGFVLPEAYVAQHYKPASGELIFQETASHSSYFCPSFEVEINNIVYSIAYNKETRKIAYIHTWSKDFRTEDGLKTGDCMNVSNEEMVDNAAWELCGPQRKDGWYPVLSIESYSRRLNGSKECMVITGFSKGGD